MGTQTLVQRTDNIAMLAAWFNQLRGAMLLDSVPRNASGVPTNEAGSVGNQDYQWLNGRFKRIYIDGNLVDVGTITGRPHRLIEAAQDANNFPAFLTAVGGGSGLTANFLATATPFQAIINNITTDVVADTTFTSLTAAPAANNTCDIDDGDLAGGDLTKNLGELDRKPITIDAIGSEISGLDGEIAAFKVNSEVFLAEIDTSNNKLWPIFRGYAGTSRGVLTNDDTITLLKLNMLLLKNDGSTKVSSTYYPETVTTAPAAGTAGKIYVERDTNKFGYDTGAAIDYAYMLVGYAVCDDTDCLYVHHWDLDLSWSEEVNIDYHIENTTTITLRRGSNAFVNGQRIEFFEDYDVTSGANMDSGESIGADEIFYIYLKEDGSAVFSTVAPRNFCNIKLGQYHPLKYFRCIGALFTNGSNEFVFKRQNKKTLERIRDEIVPVGTIVAFNSGYYTDGSNGGFTSIIGNTVAKIKAILPDNWRVCDGSEIYDPESPDFNASGRYIDNLTNDIFLMGDLSCGNIGGANTVDLEHSHTMASHVHGMLHTHNMASHTHTGPSHTHNFKHYHQWCNISSIRVVDSINNSNKNTNKVSITSSDDEAFAASEAADFSYSGGSTAVSYALPNNDFFTTGVLAAPTGSGDTAVTDAQGTGVTGTPSDNTTGNSTLSQTGVPVGNTTGDTLSTTQENKPNFLSCFYIRKIK